MQLRQSRVALEELLLCKEWEEYLYIMRVLRLFREFNYQGLNI